MCTNLNEFSAKKRKNIRKNVIKCIINRKNWLQLLCYKQAKKAKISQLNQQNDQIVNGVKENTNWSAMENMGYREGSSKLSKHRRMSRAASLAVEAGEGIPLSRYATQSIWNEKKTSTKKSMHQRFCKLLCPCMVQFTYLFYTHLDLCFALVVFHKRNGAGTALQTFFTYKKIKFWLNLIFSQ